MLDVKTLSILAKCDDRFVMTAIDSKGDSITYRGYVPDYIEGSRGLGDSFQLNVDNETGKIIGWKPMTLEKVQEMIGNGEDDEGI